jgi:hypothetical protein
MFRWKSTLGARAATRFAVRDLELSGATEQSRERDRSGTGRSKSVANVAARQRPDKLRP